MACMPQTTQTRQSCASTKQTQKIETRTHLHTIVQARESRTQQTSTETDTETVCCSALQRVAVCCSVLLARVVLNRLP